MGCSCSRAVPSSGSACPPPAPRETPNCLVSCSEDTQLRLDSISCLLCVQEYPSLHMFLVCGGVCWSVRSSDAQKKNTWGGIQTGKHLAQTESQQSYKKLFSATLDSKARKIQLVWSEIHQFLLSGGKLAVCFLWVCLLTPSPGPKAVFLSVWVERLQSAGEGE